MELAVIGIAALFAWVSFCLVWIEGDNAARWDRINRATRPRHGARILTIAPARNRLGED